MPKPAQEQLLLHGQSTAQPQGCQLHGMMSAGNNHVGG
jgi:hypothetical protein